MRLCPAADGGQLGRWHRGAGGIRRRGDHQALGAIAPVALHGGQVQLEARSGASGHQVHLGPEAAQELPIAGVGRVAHQHLVTWVDQRGGEQQQGGRGPSRHHHTLGADKHAMRLLVEAGDGLAQGGQAQGAGVGQGRVAAHDALQFGAHGRWRAKVGLAQVEPDHAVAGRFERGGALAELHGQEGCDGLGALGDLHGRAV